MFNTSTATDYQLVKKVQQEKNNEALEEIISRHTPLCLNIYQKYLPTIQASGIAPQEIYDETKTIIYNSVLSYNDNKNSKLSTWIGNQARYTCLNLINSKLDIPVDNDFLNFSIENNNKFDVSNADKLKNTIEYIFFILEQLKDKRIKKIFEMRYLSGAKKMRWPDIAKQLKLSPQSIMILHKRGKKLLKYKLKSEFLNDEV